LSKHGLQLVGFISDVCLIEMVEADDRFDARFDDFLGQRLGVLAADAFFPVAA
jgi:hypothetical protein